MRKNLLFIAVLILTFTIGCKNDQVNTELQKNKEIATKYHELNPENIDIILTDNFIGRHAKDRFTWSKEDHRKYLSNGEFKKDSIFNQVAEGNWVATRFIRTGLLNGDTVSVECMHFKRFDNGKIAEIWEYFDPRQIEIEEK